MIRRWGFFFLINIAMMVMITIVTSLLGVDRYASEQGIDYNLLLGFCLVWGMGGAFISLLISKSMAKWMFRLQIIDSKSQDPNARELVNMVHRMAKAAGLHKMPEVAVYESQEVNAFATGPSRSNSLVAVSSGLLQRMNREQVEGVIGHEVAHIANGDMVTMTLIQGVLNAFVMFLARAIAFALTRGEDRQGGMSTFLLVIVLQIALGFLAMIVINYFSRLREYRADQGGARYAGRDKMVSALKALAGTEDLVDKEHESFASLKISGSKMAALFSTHPPLSERIKRLERA
tara:strand:+ start:3383 stop:4252 length:870 start_codon:yes stop_codon:yes gene_type:complete